MCIPFDMCHGNFPDHVIMAIWSSGLCKNCHPLEQVMDFPAQQAVQHHFYTIGTYQFTARYLEGWTFKTQQDISTKHFGHAPYHSFHCAILPLSAHILFVANPDIYMALWRKICKPTRFPLIFNSITVEHAVTALCHHYIRENWWKKSMSHS